MNITINKIREECRKTGLNFIYNPQEEPDEELQNASVYFVGKDGAKEVIYNAFIMTLEYDYHLAVMEEAEEKLINKFPKLEGVDYEDYSEEQKDLLDEIIDDIYEEDLVKVQERIDVFEGDGLELEMEVALHVKQITSAEIDKFVKAFNANTIELDDRLYSFEVQEED
jgi:hypothetical protein